MGKAEELEERCSEINCPPYTNCDLCMYKKGVDDCLKLIRKGMGELLQSPWAKKNHMSYHDFEVREVFGIIDDLILKKDVEELINELNKELR